METPAAEPGVPQHSSAPAAEPGVPQHSSTSTNKVKQKLRLKATQSAPLKSQSSRNRRRKTEQHERVPSTSSSYSFDSGGRESTISLPARPLTAWDMFSEHVRRINTPSSGPAPQGGPRGPSAGLPKRMSEQHQLVLKHMKEQLLKRKLRMATLAMTSNMSDRNSEESLNCNESESSEEEDDDEFLFKRKKERALAHWAVIRRYVDDKRREKASNNEADKSWVVLRAQLRALTQAKRVKDDLYIRYGVMPEKGKRYPSNAMAVSKDATKIKEIVHKFESLKIQKLRPTQI